jgi:hypothetical protein
MAQGARSNHAKAFWRMAAIVPAAAAVFLLMTQPAFSAHPAAEPVPPAPETLSSLQDQCLARAERSEDAAHAQRQKAICIGWAVLAMEKGLWRRSKADALRDACIREAHFGAENHIREHAQTGAELCRALHATIAE